MKLDFVLFLIFSLGSTFELSNGENSAAPALRSLQQETGFIYRSNYTAEFQHLTDPGCEGTPPVLLLSCAGSSLTILNTSDASISCFPTGLSLIENGTTYQCGVSCGDCQDVYRFFSNDSATSQQGPFGSISFLCEGNSINDVGAGFEVLGDNTVGTCVASSETTRGRNFHVGVLGVSCPVPGSTNRQYVYDDTYVDCLASKTFAVDISSGQSMEQDIFACVTGAACQGQDCYFSFSNLLITSTVTNFYDTCVESSVPITSFPSPAPAYSPFEYSVRFEASWGQLYDSLETYMACSSATVSPEILISCENGAVIEYLNSTDANMSCLSLQDNQLSCLADVASIQNQLISVFYDCFGPNLPSSRVTYPESKVLCENNAIPGAVRNAITLGVSCETENAETFFYSGDLFFECGEANDDFEIFVDNSTGASLYACGSSVTFATSSVPTEQILSNSSIATDDLWISKQFTECFTFSGITAPSPPTTIMTPTTPAPIQAPVTSAVPSTKSPSPTPIDSDAAQTMNPILSFSNGSSSSSEGANDTGLWIGLFIGGVTTGIIIVAGIVFLQRRKTRAANLPVEESLVQSSLSETSCPGPLPPPAPQLQKEESNRNPRTVHNVGSEVAVIENASLAVVLEVSDIAGNQADPSGIYTGWQA